MAYAGAEFTDWVLKAAKGERKTTQSYIDLSAAEGGEKIKAQVGGLEFFSVTVTLGVRPAIPSDNRHDVLTKCVAQRC
jgi:hypothetical protein